MLISIFKPTHESRYLVEAYRSLLEQKDDNWEWVIVPNGDNVAIAGMIQADDRVRICPSPHDMIGIGRLKFGLAGCNGPLLKVLWARYANQCQIIT